MMDFESDRQKHLVQELRLQLGLMADRDAEDTPLRANEFLVSVPRERLKEIMKLAIEALDEKETHQG